jgi:hypothetical protein
VLDLSIVVPLHNAAPYITATLDSLSAQTIRPREVIVVDDGSSDDGGNLARTYRFPDGSSPIVLRNDDPEGVARARNRGVFHASGEWVALCDNDDLWHPRRIEVLGDLASSYPWATAVATEASGFALEADRDALEHHQRSPMVKWWVPDDRIETLVERVGNLDTGDVREVTFADLQQDTMFVTTLVCMRRETYAIAGGCAPWCFRADDYILNAGALLIDPIPRIEAPFAFYRVRPTSQSHHDRETALPLIAACLALRFGGRIPDTRPAGAFYRHLAGVDARNGAPLSRTLALAALGKLGPKDVKILVKSQMRGKLNAVRSRHST